MKTTCHLRHISNALLQQSVPEYHNKSAGKSVAGKANFCFTFRAIFHSPTALTHLRRSTKLSQHFDAYCCIIHGAITGN
jgi:hypothetical protein